MHSYKQWRLLGLSLSLSLLTICMSMMPSHASDTMITDTVRGSRTPQTRENAAIGDMVRNRGFKITRTGNHTTLGNGIDEETTWTFDVSEFPSFPSCSDAEIVPCDDILKSVRLKLRLTPQREDIRTDELRIEGLRPIRPSEIRTLPVISLGETRTVTLELLSDEFYRADEILSILNDPDNNGQLPMVYRDDAIISYAKLTLVTELSLAKAALVQSNFGDQGNFEVVVQEDGELCHYWRDNDDADLLWSEGPTECFGENIRSAPALIQSNFGDQGNFEIVVWQDDQLCHYFRDNDRGNLRWSREPTECFGENIRSAPALIQSNFGDQGNFEVVVQEGDQLCHYFRDNDDEDEPWSEGPTECFGEDIRSAPALIQSNFGDQGNFEVVVQQGNQLCHYFRNNDRENRRWSREPICFVENLMSE
ncbi:MAG: hypothetical protein ETSY1_32425 [Candidatus Entotheonella factor]|uniref:Uncharacterized protein n=1 Tax=Entotheonella factor TaxID=1429438 RepID=W4LAH3_ENTF1|nr:MAG: hypothetical protein ETSY1_32425 [Candidatus Entotheonella factor]